MPRRRFRCRFCFFASAFVAAAARVVRRYRHAMLSDAAADHAAEAREAAGLAPAKSAVIAAAASAIKHAALTFDAAFAADAAAADAANMPTMPPPPPIRRYFAAAYDAARAQMRCAARAAL